MSQPKKRGNKRKDSVKKSSAKQKLRTKSKVASKQVKAKAQVKPSEPYESKLIFRDVNSENDPLLRKVFWGVAGVIGLVTIILALNSGINGDDSFQNAYSDQILDFYTTMGQDTSCFYHPKGPIQYYGGFYELTTAVSNSALGFEQNDVAYHNVRHFWNALFGILAMIFTGLLARQIGGWQAGIIALGMIFLSPRFLGHSLMNPKDIPFAAGYIMAVYFMTIFIQQLPKPKISTLIGLAIGIGMGFGVRAGGLLSVAYFGMFVGITFLLRYGLQGLLKESKTLLQYIGYAAVPALVGLSIGILVWPYALVDPFEHIKESLTGLTNYAVNIKMLFGGEMIYGKDVQANYLPTWVSQTVPLFIPIGLILFAIFVKGIFKRYTPIFLFVALFTFLFPFIYVIIQKSTLYDGWRHLIFPYTSLVALVAVAWNYVFEQFKTKKAVLYGAIGVLALTALEPAWFTARNYAYPYVYFNPIAGGLQGAFGNYETDYWGVSLKQGLDWMEAEGIIGENMQDTVMIMSNFSYQLDKYAKKKYKGKVRTNYVRFRQRYDKDWDYGLFLSRFARGSHLKNGTWPPADKTVHTIDANGVPLLAILKSEDNNAYLGAQATKQQDWQNVIRYMNAEVQKYPSNEIAWVSLARAYIQIQDMNNASVALGKALELEPENLQAINLKGLFYLRTGQEDKAVETMQASLEFEPKNSVAYYYMALVDKNKKNLKSALANARKAIEVNPKFREGYNLVAQIYEESGNSEQAQRFRQAASRVK